jgi:predicted transcriptional regulator
MAGIRDQIGLDFLQKRGTEPEDRAISSGEERPSFMDEALLTYGRPMLEVLRRAAPGTVRLHNLIDELAIPIDVALRVVDHLESQRYLAVVNRDLKGNHELRLTDEGARLLR